MKIEIQPSKEHFDHWLREYVPEKDFFFLREKDFPSFEQYLHKVLVIPQEEFFEHASYQQIQLVNSYEYWNISKEAKYIIVATSGWVYSLPDEKKKQLFQIQIELGRGLILPLSCSPQEILNFKENILEKDEEQYIILERTIWGNIPYKIKEDLIKEYAKKWDDWTCYSYPEEVSLYLRKFANTFPFAAGSNCLSATLFAITKQEWIIYEWVHPRTFMQALKNENYSLISSEEIKAGDVVIWENSSGLVQHASYHIGDNLFFNKNGQTFFNPWKIIDFTELKEAWNKHSLSIYRKKV